MINAVAKVEVQTERLWKRAGAGVSRLAVINMMDRERAYFDEAAEALQSAVPKRRCTCPLGKRQTSKASLTLWPESHLYTDNRAR